MKRVNLGILAIFITVLVLTCYIVIGELSKTKDKDKIKEICIQYLKIHNKYSVLEEKYRDINNNIQTGDYEKYLTNMRIELSEYVLSENLQDIYETYKSNLDSQITGKYIVKKYSRELQDISRYKYELPYITINLDLILNIATEERLNAVKDEKTNKYIGEISMDTKTNRLNDTIIFKKIDANYKIVYHKVASNNINNDPSSFKINGGM